MNTPQKGSVWRHRKGGIYTVDQVVTHTETGEWLVVYSGEDGESWARPLSDFLDGRFTEQERPASPRTMAMSTEDFLRQVIFR